MANLQFIGDYLKQVKREVQLKDDVEYKLLGVKWYGKGMFLREIKKGKEIKADKLYQVKEGDFVYNRLFAWKSSFAIVEKEFDGCLVSNEFPTFVLKLDIIDPYFLLSLALQPNFIAEVNRASGGMSSISRKRYKEEAFLISKFPSISIKEQNKVSSKIRDRKGMVSALGNQAEIQFSLLNQLRQSILQEATEGKLTANWRKNNPVKKGDPEFDAVALLEKNKAKNDNLLHQNDIRKGKSMESVNNRMPLFTLPNGWVWCLGEKIGNFVDPQPSHRTPPESVNGVPYISMKDVNNKGQICFEAARKVSKDILTEHKKRYTLQTGDFLIGKIGTIGNPVWLKIPQDYTLSANIVLVQPKQQVVLPQFMFIVLSSNYCIEHMSEVSSEMSYPVFGIKKMRLMPFPLPPFAEQGVIVTKVNSLIASLDELENQITDRQSQTEVLMQSVLREAFEGGHSG